MNKYFLPIIFIIILFQSFRVFDEIFYNDKNDTKKGYIVINKERDNSEEKIKLDEEEKNSLSTSIDIDSLFKSADIGKGKKLSKQCQTCHDFSTNLKIKIGSRLQ